MATGVATTPTLATERPKPPTNDPKTIIFLYSLGVSYILIPLYFKTLYVKQPMIEYLKKSHSAMVTPIVVCASLQIPVDKAYAMKAKLIINTIRANE
jgi:hypothetical protein